MTDRLDDQTRHRARLPHPKEWGRATENGVLLGAMTDQQVNRVRQRLSAGGADVTYRSFPDVGHAMHAEQARLFVEALLEWFRGLEV